MPPSTRRAGALIALGTRMDGNWLVLFVRDSGVGLAPEHDSQSVRHVHAG